jgi:hypothetical protein
MNNLGYHHHWWKKYEQPNPKIIAPFQSSRIIKLFLKMLKFEEIFLLEMLKCKEITRERKIQKINWWRSRFFFCQNSINY